MKPEFKLQTKKGQTVYYIKVNIRSEESLGRPSLSDEHGIFVKELKIVHQTNHKVVLSDEFVTVLDRMKKDQKKESYHNNLEDPKVYVKSKETYWANGIFSYMYSLEDPQKCISKMKRKIKDQINKDYGFLRFIDLEGVLENMEINNIKSK